MSNEVVLEKLKEILNFVKNAHPDELAEMFLKTMDKRSEEDSKQYATIENAILNCEIPVKKRKKRMPFGF